MIFEFWQEHQEEFLDLLHQRDFPPQRIGRYKAMIERLITRGLDGTWESYDDANNYYKERTDLAEGTRQFYFSVINKLQTYHLNGEFPVSMNVRQQTQSISFYLFVTDHAPHRRLIKGVSNGPLPRSWKQPVSVREKKTAKAAISFDTVPCHGWPGKIFPPQ